MPIYRVPEHILFSICVHGVGRSCRQHRSKKRYTEGLIPAIAVHLWKILRLSIPAISLSKIKTKKYSFLYIGRVSEPILL